MTDRERIIVGADGRKYITTEPQIDKREWQGLTDEEKKAIYEQADIENWHDQPLLEAVEAKLKEKNAPDL